MNLIQLLNDLSLPINPELCWQISMSLLHSLWQGALIALSVAFLLQSKSFSVHQKFVFSFAALVLICSTPFVNFVLPINQSAPEPIRVASNEFEQTGRLKLFSIKELSGRANLSSPARHLNGHLTDSNRDLAASSFKADAAKKTQHPDFHGCESIDAMILPTNWTSTLSGLVALAYFSGVLLMMVRLGLGLLQQRRFTMVSTNLNLGVPAQISDAAKRAALILNREFSSKIVVFSGLGAAFVAGIFRPLVFVNIALVSGLTPVQLEQILAHELAHIYRWDPLTQLVQRLIESILFFHPGVWFVSRKVSDLRELCCDEWVAAEYSRVEYAESLLHCVMLTQANSTNVNSVASLAATGNRASQLTSRIEFLLGGNQLEKTIQVETIVWQNLPQGFGLESGFASRCMHLGIQSTFSV